MTCWPCTTGSELDASTGPSMTGRVFQVVALSDHAVVRLFT